MFDVIDVRVDGAAAFATFNRPAKLNAIDEAFLADLPKLLDMVEADARISTLVLRGAGRAFCVGLDLGLLDRAFDDMAYFEGVIRRLNACLLRLERLPVAVVSAVNGYARAGGFEITLASDVVLIADEAKIGDQHTHVHVMPGGGSTQRLPARIGAQQAKDLIWSARWLSGQEAAALGLALRSVPLADLDDAVETLIAPYRDRPRAMIAAIKRAMLDGASRPIAEGIGVEMQQFVGYMRDGPYARAGFRASRATAAA